MPNAALKEIYFDFDKSNVRPGDAKILDASATYLKANPNQLVLIEGHCDERGTIEYNLALGERRAKSAMNYLVAQGIDASRFTLISYGKERPVCTEKTEACWAKNRFDRFLTKAPVAVLAGGGPVRTPSSEPVTAAHASASGPSNRSRSGGARVR